MSLILFRMQLPAERLNHDDSYNTINMNLSIKFIIILCIAYTLSVFNINNSV